MTTDSFDRFADALARAYLDDRTNDSGLRHLVDGLARAEPMLEGSPNWVSFLADDAQIDAEVKHGMGFPVLSIDAYLLSADDTMPTRDQVQAWVASQPKPSLGMLSVGEREHETGTIEYVPLLSVDAQLDSILAEFIRDLIVPLAEAWDSRTVADYPERDLGGGEGDGGGYRLRPTEIQPRNAWLLMGSEASYPSADEIQQQWERGEAGLFDDEWTAPKNGEFGDLVLIYFVAPRKAACFIARLASGPYWRTDVEVNAVSAVGQRQWWAATSPLVEIEPIPYQAIQEAAGGYLPLRGRSGHYLSPRSISALRFVAKDPARQKDVDLIAQLPIGNPDLPAVIESLEDWKATPGGALPLEAKVSEHVVEPLARLLWGPDQRWAHEHVVEPTLGPIALREQRVPSGLVDFVFEYAGEPALAVEVKLTMLRPVSGVWADSPDFRQLQRYMSDLTLPGLLVDAQRILLVRAGASAPFAEIVRIDATWTDIALIRDLMLEARWGVTMAPVATGPAIAAPRRIARRG